MPKVGDEMALRAGYPIALSIKISERWRLTMCSQLFLFRKQGGILYHFYLRNSLARLRLPILGRIE